MASIATLITEVRVDINDSNSTRFSTDTPLLTLFKKAIRRANRICQRNDINFAKKKVSLSTVAAQNYIDISSSVADFDVWIGLYYEGEHREIEPMNELEWNSEEETGLTEHCLLDQANSKIYLKGTPSAVLSLDFWYYPTVDTSTYTTSTSTPWSGRLDDIIMEYVRMRALNMDEMDLSFDSQLMTDMENQILESYKRNSVGRVNKVGWMN